MSTTTSTRFRTTRRRARDEHVDEMTSTEAAPRVIDLQVRRVELWPRSYR